jgi:oligosaccharide repeat unit polymerase
MSFISFISFLSAFIVLIFSIKRTVDKYSPLRVFWFIWLIAIGMADLKLSYYQHPWSVYSWIILLLGPLSFSLAIIIVNIIKLNAVPPAVSKVRNTFQSLTIDARTLCSVTIILFALYVFSYLLNATLSGYIPMFAFAPGVTRTQWGIFGVGLFIHSAPVILYLVVQYFLFANRKWQYNSIFIFIFLVTFGSYLLLLQRYNLALWAIMSFVMAYYATKKIKLRNMAFVSAIIGLALIIINNARFTRHIENYLFLTSRMKFPIRYALFTEPYMYLVMGLENFTRAVDKLDHFTLGYFSINPLLSITGLKHSLIQYFTIDETPYLISGYNTFPFHWYYYYDFGIVGVLGGSFLLGLIIAVTYWKMHENPTYVSVSMYAICVFVMMMSFYLNPLTMLNFIYVIIITFITQSYINRPQHDYK